MHEVNVTPLKLLVASCKGKRDGNDSVPRQVQFPSFRNCVDEIVTTGDSTVSTDFGRVGSSTVLDDVDVVEDERQVFCRASMIASWPTESLLSMATLCAVGIRERKVWVSGDDMVLGV